VKRKRGIRDSGFRLQDKKKREIVDRHGLRPRDDIIFVCPEARNPIPEARFTPQGGENPIDFGKFPVLEKTLNRGCVFLHISTHTVFF
jgi:hypothetical protein